MRLDYLYENFFRMGLDISQRHELVLEIRHENGAAQSIFGEVERWLEADSDHINVVQKIGNKKTMAKYRDLIDFIFCEVFPAYKQACQDYYEGKGSLLRDQISPAMIKVYEKQLLEFLNIAYNSFKADREVSWSQAAQIAKQGEKFYCAQCGGLGVVLDRPYKKCSMCGTYVYKS